MINKQQTIHYEKKCPIHKEELICFLQIGHQKSHSIGACKICVVDSNLRGNNLALISQIENMINSDQPTQKQFLPILDDKEILTEYLKEISSAENKDRFQEIKQFFGEIKNQIINNLENLEKQVVQKAQQQLFVDKKELVKTFDEVQQKGKFKVLFKDYMLDDQNYGKKLQEFIIAQVEKSKINSQLLKQKLDAFNKNKQLIKVELNLQQKLKNIFLNLIQITSQTIQIDVNNQLQLQQIECFCDRLEAKLKRLNSLNQYQIQNQQNQKKIILLNFIESNYKNISSELINLSQNVFSSEIQFLKSLEENNRQSQLPKDNQQNIFNKFSQDIKDLADKYFLSIQDRLKKNNVPQNDFQIYDMIQKCNHIYVHENLPIINKKIQLHIRPNTYHYSDFKQSINNNFQYRLQLEFKPIQNKEANYSFCIGLKNCNQLYTQNDQFKNFYFLSNRFQQIHTQAAQGMIINDKQISQSQQMRKLEFIFCLKNKQLQLLDIPNKQNVTIAIANDERLSKIDLNETYGLFIFTSDIQEINVIDYRIISQPIPNSGFQNI